MGGVRRKKELDVPVLIASLIAGVVGCLVSSLVYGIINAILWTPLAVGLSFMIFAIIFIVIMVIVNLMNDNLTAHIRKAHDGGQTALVLIGIVLLTLVLGILFEFLYEIDMYSEQDLYQDATSYVFIIDNSGSMSDSDPNGLRYSAINKIMEEKDESFPYAVYSFSDTVVVDRELAPISAGNNEFQPKYLGGTYLKNALSTVFDEYQNKLKSQMGKSPKFLVLSDGYASDIGLFSRIDPLLEDISKTNISISTVGLGTPDEVLMQQIADETGGVYVSVNDVDTLEESMKEAITKYGEDKYARTLYTRRNVPHLNFVYAIMRILFMSLLAILISLSMLFATGKSEDSDRIIVSSIITGVLGGVLVEAGTNLLRLPPGLMKLIYFVLVALTFITVKAYTGIGKGDDIQNTDMFFQGRNREELGQASGINSAPPW